MNQYSFPLNLVQSLTVLSSIDFKKLTCFKYFTACIPQASRKNGATKIVFSFFDKEKIEISGVFLTHLHKIQIIIEKKMLYAIAEIPARRMSYKPYRLTD
jgi:hypothetical protein